ncbi:MAG: FkbM family methyltransferase [Candidatus Campbellbacteria bacterium]|nr:FkbM family methyltransferase [Candidatus Campbellbacteria bacterium]
MEKTFESRYGKFTFDVSTNTRMARHFEKTGFFYSENIETILKYITSDSVVLDIGAHIGTTVIPLAKASHRVHAFEPVTENRKYLYKNIEQNKITNVEVHECALGAKNGTVTMTTPDSTNTGAFAIHEGGNVPLKTLDSLNLGQVDFIKIDVEGHEPEVFEGAKNTIKQYKPFIFFEFFLPDLRKNNKHPLKKIHKALKDYTFYVNGNRFFYLWMIVLWYEPKLFFFNQGGIVIDVLAIPRQKFQRLQG